MNKTGVLLLLPALLAVGCFRSTAPTSVAESFDPELARQGEIYYSDWGCGACHGDLGRGTDDAPPLVDLRGRWTVAELAGYMLDPQAYGEADARVRALQERYPDIEMPAFDFPEDQRRAVGVWLLTLDRRRPSGG